MQCAPGSVFARTRKHAIEPYKPVPGSRHLIQHGSVRARQQNVIKEFLGIGEEVWKHTSQVGLRTEFAIYVPVPIHRLEQECAVAGADALDRESSVFRYKPWWGILPRLVFD